MIKVITIILLITKESLSIQLKITKLEAIYTRGINLTLLNILLDLALTL